jgi:protein arginine N-methyltransferase 1
VSGTLAEHRSYLVDERRLARYASAIDQVVKPGDTVADLGCGFGILGLLCLKAGAAKAWGIDGTDAVEIAAETARRLGFGDQYACVNEQTFRAELPEKVDVLICDHVGYFGIDYGILNLMIDARRRMLKPGGRMIPERLRLYLAGVRSRACRSLLDTWETSDVPADFNWLRSYAVSTKHPVDYRPAEIVTEPVLSGAVELGEDVAETLAFKATLLAEDEGVIDGIGGWFDCDLGGGVSMTNSPLARDRIKRYQIFLGFDQPLAVKPGDSVEVSVRVGHQNSVMAWSVRDPATGRLQKYSNWASMPMAISERMKPSVAPRTFNERGRAVKIVLGYIDNAMTGEEIEQAVLRDHPDLFPSPQEIARFVRDELARYST